MDALKAEPNPGRDRRWLGWLSRIARGLAWALVTLALLVAVLHLPPAQRGVRALLVRLLSRATGGTVALEGLRYGASGPGAHAHFEGLSLRLEGTEIEIPQAEASWALGRGLVVSVEQPSVTIRMAEEPTPAHSQDDGRPWRLLSRFERADVTGGRVELRDPQGKTWLTLESVTAHLAKVAGRHRLGLRAIGGAGWPGGGIQVPDIGIEAEAEMEDDGRLRITEGRLTTGSATGAIDGTLDRISPVEARLRASMDLDTTLLNLFLPALDARGRIVTRGEIEVHEGQAQGLVGAEASALFVKGLGPWTGTAKGSLRGGRLQLEALGLTGYRGEVQGTGEVALGDGRTRLDLRTRGLDVRSLVRSLSGTDAPFSARADGRLAFSLDDWNTKTLTGDGTVSLSPERGPGLPLAGTVAVKLVGERLDFTTEELRARELRVAGKGGLGFDGALDLRYESRLPDLGAVRVLLSDAGVVAPDLALAGSLAAHGRIEGTLPDVVLTAQLHADSLSLEGIDLAGDASLRVDARQVEVEAMTLRGPGGAIEAHGRLPLAKGHAWDLEAGATGLDLSHALARHGVPLQARADGSLLFSGTVPSDPDWEARFETQAGPESASGNEATAPVPITARATLHKRGRTVRLDALQSDLAGGTFEAAGSYALDTGDLDGRARAAAVQLERLPWVSERAPDLAGTLSGDAQASGPLGAPRGTVRAALRGAAYRGTALPDLLVEAHSDGAVLEGTGTLRHGEDDRRLVTTRMPLEEPYLLHAEADLSALPLQAALDAFPAVGKKVSGFSVDGRATVDLPLRHIRDLRYDFRPERMLATVGGHPLSAGAFSVTGGAGNLAIAGLRLHGPATQVTVEGSVGFADDSPSSLDVKGETDLGVLAPLLADTELTGRATFAVRLEDLAPEVLFAGELNVDAGAGRWGRLGWESLDLAAVTRAGVLDVQRFRARLLGGSAEAKGALPIRADAGTSGVRRLEFALRGLDLGTLVVSAEAETRPSAVVDVEGALEADAPRLSALRAEGRVTRLAVRSGAASLDLAAAAAWRYEGQALALEPLQLEGSAGHLRVAPAVHGLPDSPRLEAVVSGEVDLALANVFLEGKASVAGPARLDLRASAGAKGVALSGDAGVTGARLVLHKPPLTVSNLAGTLRFEERTVELRDLTGEVGDGRLEAGGTLGLGPRGLERADLRLHAERVPLVYPEGLQSRFSGDLRLQGEGTRYRLEGEVQVLRALFDRNFDAASQSLDTAALELAALDLRDSFMDHVQLGVRATLVEPLRIRNAQAELQVDGSLELAGTLAEPSLSGAFTLREGGTYTIGRARMRIREGRATLTGYPAQAPELDMSGSARVSGIGVDIDVTGHLGELETRLSAPDRSDLTQGDLASLLLTGRTAQSAASESGTIVAEQLATALGGVVNQKLSASPIFVDISPDQSVLSTNTEPGLRLNIGLPVGPRLVLIHSAALDGTDRWWILDYKAGGQLRLRAISEQGNEVALEVTHRFGFRVFPRKGPIRETRTKRPVVQEVRFEGGGPLSPAQLAEKAKVKPGSRYEYFRAEKAGERVRDALANAGHLAAQVEHAALPAGEGKVVLQFKLEPGPRIEITWSGDDPGKAARKKVLAVWDRSQPLETIAARRAREVAWTLQAEGYVEAAVSARVEAGEGVAAVTLDVRRGPKAARVAVRFEGNAEVPGLALVAVLPRTNKPEFFSMLTDERQRLDDLVRLRYAQEGFVRTRVLAPRTAWDPPSRTLTVTIPIEEGPRALVESVVLPEEVASATGPGVPKPRLVVGRPFNIEDYLADRNALATWYRSEGYPEARVASVLEPREGNLQIVFSAEPGPRPRVGQVKLAREGRTREATVDDLVSLEPGDLIRPNELAASRDRLSESRAFRSVDLRTVAVPGGGETRDILVDLVPRPDVEIEYGVRYTSRSSNDSGGGGAPSDSQGKPLQFAGGLEMPNPFGRASRIRLQTVVNGSRLLNSFTFDTPTFLSKPLRTQLFVYDDNDLDTEIQGLASRVQAVSLQQTKRWRQPLPGRSRQDRLFLQYGYTFKVIRYTATGSGEALEGDRGFMSVSLIGDARDSITDPHRGLFWTVGTDLAAKALGSDVNYARLFGQVFAYVPLGSKVVWAQALRVGVVPGSDPLLLLDTRFQAGGATTVRGFAQNALGPQTLDGESLGGQGLLIFNEELRFPIWQRLRGGVFYDAGNVWALAADLSWRDLRQSVGGGFRFLFPFGPLRLDWARVLNPREGEQRSRFVFSLGYAF